MIEAYEKIYIQQREYARKSKVPSIVQYKLKPNKMQVAATQSLDAIREKGEAKALLISATGTGKTYLSAFDLRNVAPQCYVCNVKKGGNELKLLQFLKRKHGENVFSNLKSIAWMPCKLDKFTLSVYSDEYKKEVHKLLLENGLNKSLYV